MKTKSVVRVIVLVPIFLVLGCLESTDPKLTEDQMKWKEIKATYEADTPQGATVVFSEMAFKLIRIVPGGTVKGKKVPPYEVEWGWRMKIRNTSSKATKFEYAFALKDKDGFDVAYSIATCELAGNEEQIFQETTTMKYENLGRVASGGLCRDLDRNKAFLLR